MEETEERECIHFWVIEENSGPTSIGTCKYCGEKKEFFNYIAVSHNPLRTDRMLRGSNTNEVSTSDCTIKRGK